MVSQICSPALVVSIQQQSCNFQLMPFESQQQHAFINAFKKELPNVFISCAVTDWQPGQRRMRYSPGVLLRPIPTRQNETFVVLKAEQVTRFETTTKVEKKLDRFVTGVFYKS